MEGCLGYSYYYIVLFIREIPVVIANSVDPRGEFRGGSWGSVELPFDSKFNFYENFG